jgi:hypothetical protein
VPPGGRDGDVVVLICLVDVDLGGLAHRGVEDPLLRVRRNRRLVGIGERWYRVQHGPDRPNCRRCRRPPVDPFQRRSVVAVPGSQAPPRDRARRPADLGGAGEDVQPLFVLPGRPDIGEGGREVVQDVPGVRDDHLFCVQPQVVHPVVGAGVGVARALEHEAVVVGLEVELRGHMAITDGRGRVREEHEPVVVVDVAEIGSASR